MAKKAVKLYGTERVEPKGRVLTAGALSAVLDSGSLRYVKLDGVEVLRAIAFLVRDENWGTFTPEIKNLSVRQSSDGFTVTYQGRCADDKRSLSYSATINGSASGVLTFSITATPRTDFLTNRTGFVVLHPLKGVAGQPVTVEHVDGKKEKSRFPALINPMQPFFDVRALSHTAMPGVTAEVRMEGDAFETEDHRNWTDASFKTYVRPLARPWPYTLEKGESFEQSVTLTLKGKLPKPRKARGDARIDIELGRAKGRLPEIGTGIPMDQIEASLEQADLIKQSGVRHLVCQIDGRRDGIAEAARGYRELGDRTGARISLEITLPGTGSPRDELQPIADAVALAGLKPDAVAVTTAADLRAVLPGSEGAGSASFEEIYAAARAAFPDVTLGGGMFSYFTELNRKPPPAELLDFVTHTTCPTVHAADDISVMETLEALPYVIRSARAIMAGKPYHVGPSAIACRDNPYGASVAPNPDNGRVCLPDMDPRQRGLFGAAWTLGYLAAFSEGGAASVTMGSATGSSGMIYRKAGYAQPGYDGVKGTLVYPVYHVMAGLAPHRGARRLSVVSGDPSTIAVLAYQTKAGPAMWLANLTDETQSVRIRGMPGSAALHLIDEASFDAVIKRPDLLARSGRPLKRVGPLELGPYAIARVQPD